MEARLRSSAPHPPVESPERLVGAVLVLKSDPFYGDALRHAVMQVHPGATVKSANRIDEAANVMAALLPALLIAGTELLDGDVLEFIGEWKRRRGKTLKVLIVTGRKEARVLMGLKALPIEGVFDPGEGSKALRNAVRSVLRGECIWSRSVIDLLEQECFSQKSPSRALTVTEQVVLAVIGDGTDDKTAAAYLGLRKGTIATVRRELHRKLDVQHKGELVRIAIRHGFVRLTAEGTSRPGWSMLLEAWKAQSTRRKVSVKD